MLRAEPRPEVVRREGGVPRRGDAGGRRQRRGVEERRDEGQRLPWGRGEASAEPTAVLPRSAVQELVAKAMVQRVDQDGLGKKGRGRRKEMTGRAHN